jgi:hypothetical protein
MHSTKRADDSILVIGQIPLVWPTTNLEWALLVGTVVCLLYLALE